MPREPFQESYSCAKCGALAKRVFEAFLSERNLREDKSILVRPKVLSYMVIDWLCCANQECKNWFNRWPNFSRCPICHHWSVAFELDFMNKYWECRKTKDCGWKFSLISKDSPRH